MDELGVGQGQLRNGCSFSVMDDWLAFLESQSCGNCIDPHGGLGCEQSECEASVCALDPFCCDVAWDGVCAAEALDICVPDICIALPSSSTSPAFYREGRGPEPEPISKDPNYVNPKPKE